MAAAIKIVSERLLAGEKAQAKWKHGNKWFNVVVDAVNDDGTYSLSYEDGDKWDSVPPNRIRRMNGIILLDIQEPEKKKGNRALDKSGKWEILRNAILSSKASNVSSGDSSIHRHDGFHMFQKTVETDSTRIEEGYHVVSYKIPNSTDDGDVSLRILERQVGAKLSLSEIAPGKYGHGEGVDNTGNVRVWPAEEVIWKYKNQYVNIPLSSYVSTKTSLFCFLTYARIYISITNSYIYLDLATCSAWWIEEIFITNSSVIFISDNIPIFVYKQRQ